MSGKRSPVGYRGAEMEGGRVARNTAEGRVTLPSEYHANVALVAFYSVHLRRVGQSCPRS